MTSRQSIILIRAVDCPVILENTISATMLESRHRASIQTYQGLLRVIQNSEVDQLTHLWDSAGSEIRCRSDDGKVDHANSNGVQVNGDHESSNGTVDAENTKIPIAARLPFQEASNSKYAKEEAGVSVLPAHDEDSLYAASINGPKSRDPKENSLGMHAHRSLATDIIPSSMALVHSRGNDEQKEDEEAPMPALAPYNPGCAVCTVLLPAMKCVGCRKVQFCSPQCQKSDWDKHKAVCNAQAQTKVSGKGKQRVSTGL